MNNKAYQQNQKFNNMSYVFGIERQQQGLLNIYYQFQNIIYLKFKSFYSNKLMIRKNIVLTQNYNPVLVFPLKHGQPHSTQTSQNLLPQNYCFKAYLQNLIYDQNIKNFQSICRQIDQLKNSIQLRKNKHSISHHPIKQKSRIRRTADMIQKKYKCNEKNCYRSYGCQVSLKLHKKLKHSLSPATDKQNQIPDCQQKITSKISTVWCTESSNLD